MRKKLNIANVVTASRIIFAVLVMFSDIFSVWFYTWYVLGAFSDMIDGTLARRLKLQSSFGARLDTACDSVFIIAVIVKTCLSFSFPAWIWIWTVGITLIKIVNVISGIMIARGIVPMHTVMNKITGFMLFTLPFVIGLFDWKVAQFVIIIIGCVATLAAVQEGHYIRIGKVIE